MKAHNRTDFQAAHRVRPSLHGYVFLHPKYFYRLTVFRKEITDAACMFGKSRLITNENILHQYQSET